MLQQVQLYDDRLDFPENKDKGPFGDFADIKVPYQNQGEPQYDFFGIPVYSPFGIAAGPLPTTRFIQAALDKGFDIVTLKSVRTDMFPLNPYPQVRPVLPADDLDALEGEVQVADQYTEPLAVANSFGIPSVKPAEWQTYMRDSFKLIGKGQALLVAFQGTPRDDTADGFVQDHVKGIDLIRKTGANIIEINLSCSNIVGHALTCFDTDMTERIVKAVRQAHPNIKLIIKLAYFSNHKELRGLIWKVGKYLDGISAINTIPATVTDAEGKEVFPGRPKAGISGAPIKWAGLEMARYLKEFREEFHFDYKIVGMGGVLNAKDFHEYLDAGADIVMSVTGAMWNPNLAAEIKQSL
jgi:dihydroorotate dehydrogenase